MLCGINIYNIASIFINKTCDCYYVGGGNVFFGVFYRGFLVVCFCKELIADKIKFIY